MQLVIMAGGMGSRFGGLKQIEPIHGNGEFIIDYSIYDAIKNGFNKVVFIIKEENYDVFRNTIGKRIENIVNVEYVFQKNDNVPKEVELPLERVKPLGTGHAILCCKDVVDEDFVVVNSDDFYGYDAFRIASEFINNKYDDNEFAMISYKIGNTLTKNGSVKRGVCEEANGYLTRIKECSVREEEDVIVAKTLEGDIDIPTNRNTVVSMNMFAFTPKVFELLENDFLPYLEEHRDSLLTCEYLLPEVICNNIDRRNIKVKVLKTDAKWSGMTYKEDKEELVNEINKLVEDGVYPDKLWD